MNAKEAGKLQNALARAIGRLGEKVWAQWDELRHAAAVIGTVLYVCVRPRSWVRTVRNMFARQVLALGQAGDVFIGLSTSGRSPNILVACKAARERGMTVIGVTGA